MKRLLVVAAIGFGLSIFAAQAASPAGSSDAQGPPCSNITNGDGAYGDGAHLLPNGVIDFTVFLQAPACSFVTYSFAVTETSGAAITPLAATQDANCTPETPDGGCVHYVYSLDPNRPVGDVICVIGTTDIHGHVADRAPSSSDTCVSLTKGAAGASGGFN
jgi:hypothetical protein